MKTSIFGNFGALTVTAAVILGGASVAYGDVGHGKGPAFGEPGKEAAVTRTIKILMQDNSFEPEAIKVKAGETVRFELKNAGEFLHEFNIGTRKMHAGHRKEMARMMEQGMLTPTGMNMNMDHSKTPMKNMPMKHDDPNSALVEPGKSGQLIWKFTKPTKIEFACNIPGHYESGMSGRIKFAK